MPFLLLKNQTSISLLLCLVVVVVSAFQTTQFRVAASRRERCRIPLASNLSGPEEFDDGIGDINGGFDNDAKKKDGEDLAKEFFRQQRERDQTKSVDAASSVDGGDGGNFAQTSQSKNNDVRPIPPIDRSRSLFDEPAGFAGRPTSASDGIPKRKFTGRREDSGPQVFSSRTSAGQARSPREVMMEREYELVGRAERGLGLQAIFAVLALVFYIYIGASGGIVTGDAAVSDDFGGDDTIFFEEIMPVQRDSESSVWL